MPEQSKLKNKSDVFFDEKHESVEPVLSHKWSLISVSVFIFLVLPLLFIWSSLESIHPPSS